MIARQWECPSCDARHTTTEHRPHTPFHPCAGMRGLSTPFVPAGTAAVHRRVEREDYIGTEQVQTDADGRPVMAVFTETADRMDCTIYAPTATVTAQGEF